MSIISNSVDDDIFGAASLPNASQNQGNGQQGTTGTIHGDKAPSLYYLLKHTAMATSLSTEGVEFTKKFVEFIKAQGPVDMEVVNLTQPANTMALMYQKNAIIFIFDEAVSFSSVETLPATAKVRDAVENLRSKVGTDVRVIQPIVITQQDYARATIWAAQAINQLMSVVSPEVRAVTVESLENLQLEISTNPEHWQRFQDKYNPHAVPCRNDIKLVITGVLNKRNNNNVNYQNIFDQAEDDRVEIASISAYVRLSASSMSAKFIPEIHISEIIPSMPFPGLQEIALSIATTTLHDSGLWKSQFDAFGANIPNIGNLIVTQDGNTFDVTNESERNFMVQNYLEPAVLILDHNVGRLSIPGIESFSIPMEHPKIIRSYNAFLKADLPETVSPGRLLTHEYTGTVQVTGHSGQAVDSKWIDFLTAIIHRKHDRMSCMPLLSHYDKPELTASHIRKLHPELKVIYDTHYVLLTPDVLRKIQERVNTAIRTVNGQVLNGTMDMSALLNAGMQLNQFQSVNSAYMGNSASQYGSTIYNNLGSNLFG